MRILARVLLATVTSLNAQTKLQSIVLDECDDISAWRTFQSAGVVVSEHPDGGSVGGALRFDVAFTKGSGYGGVTRNFNIPLPENYELTFSLCATVPVNNFEVKISNDSAGQDIWWVNTKNFSYPTQWKKFVVKKRHLSFAWGPHPAVSPDTLRRLELVVTAGSGGGGSVWVDKVELRALPLPPTKIPPPTVLASSFVGKNAAPLKVLPGAKGAWVSKTGGAEWIELDLKYPREIGGVQLRWDAALKGLTYDILGSIDGKRYDTLHSVLKGKGGSALIFTPESEAQFVRLSLHGNQSHIPYRLEEMSVVPSESLSTSNHFIEHLALSAPKGWYPRYFLHQASYWTVVGVPSDRKEALFSEDGSFEVDKRRFSIEPFITSENGHLLTWANAKCEQSLESGYIPIPTVKRIYDGITLSVTLLASGEANHSALLARYLLKNTSTQHERGALYLALRPFQVNPTYQWLNLEGGFARTDSISIQRNRAVVGEKSVIVSDRPDAVAATHVDGGEIIEHIATKQLPQAAKAIDAIGMASAAFKFSFDLNPADSIVIVAAIPFTPNADRWTTSPPTRSEFDITFNEVRSAWERTLNTVHFDLPPEAQAYIDIIRSNLAYILVNKDGPGFQPGSRSYERSWIRDGSMTSAALLKFGMSDDVKKYVEWYSSFQYENGMVPCVVDGRGPDPVPENDSHGELIFACMEYFRFTRDTAFLRTSWSNIVSAVNYIQHLRGEQMTSVYRDGDEDKRACYGLVTESISHEGYSAKPMHSYWDDFFALKGLKDAAAAAAVLGEKRSAHEYDSLVLAFRTDLYNSISLAMKYRKIDFVPGCVELGDFDPTSTSIALFPCGETKYVPEPAYTRSFNKYYDWSSLRARNETGWEAYTPYEIRNVGTFIYLGQKERAHKLIEWFMEYQRPQGWNHWAEVVWHDERLPRFIGDMPHTWVGSDFINAIRAMFIYESDDDSGIVVGAGLKDDWVKHGLSVEGLPTHFGTISYSISHSAESKVIVHLEGTLDAGRSPLLIPITLLSTPMTSATVDSVLIHQSGGFVKVTHLPATVELNYQ